MNVKEVIMNLIQKKYTIDETVDLEKFNYIESGFVDSLGIIQFIAELEDEFSIEFSDEELASTEFKTVGGVIKIVEEKIKQK